MSRLAESDDGNLYPARGEPGGISRNLENRLRLILMMGKYLFGGLSGVGKQRENIRDT